MPPISLSVDGSVIHESNRFKNLGLVIDRSLNYELHIDQLVGRCTCLFIGLSHARHRLPKETRTSHHHHQRIGYCQLRDTALACMVVRLPNT